MKRRDFLYKGIGMIGLGALASFSLAPWAGLARADNQSAPPSGERIEKMTKSNQEWKAELTPQQYDVMREEGTERPFTSPLLDEHRKGVFACAGCGLPLFDADAKFDSGTGWPSFFQAMPEHVETKTDHKLLMARTEYHCARCGAHQGHVFNDGPQPTGLRYCNNGVALKFEPKQA
jgi:peptide-methionine (R)-S-oxide reductase